MTQGGKRPGAGRPRGLGGTGMYGGEPAMTVRIPRRAYAEVTETLAKWRRERDQNAGTQPARNHTKQPETACTIAPPDA